ncbi:Ger(x)C family spore germination C-terminal domain-containing protein [Paenibacillus sp. LHD-117]|uniref:Ger(x)C family spore germination protein n=1 Tax=Paenibacillus sp. LHD-117 TaxID=3071412 RepID=UPI0027E05523|nr:Ger(x)C family spore germination C-terminal domain-containing protein [Paenibacillus sp. LHD-117]MDQ6419443.1 Ger(x)C family spore germination C-terminal domain-containing protein [Paenibacillus sp. LHD-117]
MSPRRRWFMAVAIGALLIFSSGCTAMPDIQSNAYAAAIGIDYKDGKWIAYAQIINFTTIAHSDQVEVGKDTPVWIGEGEGDTVSSALIDVGEASQLRMFWGHVKVLVMTEAALKKNVQDVYSAINRYREVRYTVYVYGTDRDMREVLMQKSILNMSPLYTKMYTGTQASSDRSFLLPVTANRLIANLNEPGEPASIPSIGVDIGDWTEDDKQKPMFILTGAYYFHDNKLAGWLSADELRGARWAESALERTPLVVRKDDKPLGLIMFSHPELSIRSIADAGGAKFRIGVEAEGYVMEMMDHATMEELKRIARQSIGEEVEATFLKGVKHGCDPFGLSEELYRSNPKSFRKLAAERQFFLTLESLAGVDVKVRLINTGKYQGTPP